jgi:hypothetical protein
VALNQALRTLGGSIGSAAVGALLASATLAGSRLPQEHGYTLAFAGTAVGCALLAAALVAAPLLRDRPPRTDAPRTDRRRSGRLPLPAAGLGGCAHDDRGAGGRHADQ